MMHLTPPAKENQSSLFQIEFSLPVVVKAHPDFHAVPPLHFGHGLQDAATRADKHRIPQCYLSATPKHSENLINAIGNRLCHD
jgi:hypothetical protein